MQALMLAGMLEWMPVDKQLPVEPLVYEADQTFEVGRTYWRLLQANEGQWCTNQDSDGQNTCDSVSGQVAMMVKPTGIAFDYGGDLYMVDGESSEILKSTFSKIGNKYGKTEDSTRYTSDGCPCN
eukprot:6469973-Amphidinium_carterae.1